VTAESAAPEAVVESPPSDEALSASAPASGSSTRRTHVVIAVLLTFGGLLRVREYLADRSLWLDELAITRNIVNKSFAELLKPLSAAQSAPVGWLWLERATVSTFGNNEWSLRLFPFVFSIGSLVVFYFVVTRWLGGLSAALATAMFALSPLLIRYSVEVKQYGSDVFFVLLVIDLTTRLHDRPSRGLLVAWTAVCMLAMWCSDASVLAIAGSGAVLFAIRVRARQRVTELCVAAAVLTGSLALEYVVSLGPSERNSALRLYWSKGLAPQSFAPGRTLAWLWHSLVEIAVYPMQLTWATIGLAAVCAGLVLFVARRGMTSLLLLSPVAVVIAGGLLRQYPLSARLILWLAPILFIGLASLADTRIPLRRNPIAIAGAVIVCALSLPLLRGVNVVTKPIDIMDSRGAYAFAARHLETGDAVITDNVANLSYQYYAPRYHLQRVAVFALVSNPEQCAAGTSMLRKIRDNDRRAWVILTDHSSSEPKDRIERAFTGFRRLFGAQGATFRGPGDASAAVFDIQPQPAPSAPSPFSETCVFLHAARSFSS
jgi:hypothetical protein